MTPLEGPLDPDGRVVVVGASLAGLRSIQALREGGFRGEITCVGDEPHLPYDRPPLSKQFLSGQWGAERLALIATDALDALNVRFELGIRADALDAQSARVTLEDGRRLDSTAVIVATGVRARRLGGASGSHAGMVVRTLEDSSELRRSIEGSGEHPRVVIVGGGFIGAEVASSANAMGAKVTIVEGLAAPLANALGEQVGRWCGALHERNGVALRVDTGVERLDGFDSNENPGGGSVLFAGGERLRADVVVVGIGAVPNTEWLEGSGLEIDDGVVVDDRLFSRGRVLAAGDVARFAWRREPDRANVRIEHWDVASQMGSHAARNLLSGRLAATPFDPVPYFWSDLYGLRIQVLGRPRPDDEVVVVEGDPQGEDPGFVALYGRAGIVSAVVGLSRPRSVMLARAMLVTPTDLQAARDWFAQR